MTIENRNESHRSHRRNGFYGFILIAAMLVATGCRRQPQERQAGDIEIKRFERVLMDDGSRPLEAAIAAFREQYASPLLALVPEDTAFMAMVYDYREDATMRYMDSCVQRRYGSLSYLEHELSEALRKAEKLDDEIRFSHFATFIGSAGYESRVVADRESESVLIAIDQYVMKDMERYGYFGDPQYIVHLSDSAYLSTDCMAAIAHEYIAMPPEPWTLLDRIVAEGKELYFLEQTLPEVPDSIRIRYTAQQYEWMQANEKNVWSYIMQSQLLYSTGENQYHNLTDEAPKTNKFGEESAPRTTEYIGWQIVRQYMKKKGSTLKELFEETDSQKILTQSNYHP